MLGASFDLLDDVHSRLLVDRRSGTAIPERLEIT